MGEANEVLVVDNHAGVRAVLDNILRHHGLGVRLASGVREAVRVYEGHRATIGVVLLDVVLDDGDGPAALALLREIDPSVRCCFFTGGASGYSDDELLALGAWWVFRKPVPSYAVLARTLAALIELPPREEGQTASRLPQNEIECPAASNMRAGGAQVG
jgi:DNA-binding NtrC family response regulator